MRPARVRARYDAAQTTDENRRHWGNADSLSANAANDANVRRTLRNRSRYETANNCYARGVISTLANDCIGTGPRLQLTGSAAADNQKTEAAFAEWAREIKLAQKLRTARMAVAQDGEAFLMFVANDNLRSSVKLDVVLIEADRVATPNYSVLDKNAVDGIVFDAFGNPQTYHVLKQHPGDTANFTAGVAEKEDVPAARMIHLYRQDRAEQRRGIPEITPALPLFAQLRRFTLAVLMAAENAADMAGWLFTDQSPDEQTAAEGKPWENIELERGMFTVAPFGYKPHQMQAAQPTTTYPDFKAEILNEIARCLHMPYNIAACNSSGYNYASGRLDHQTYDRAITVDHQWFEDEALDRVLMEWAREAVLIDGLLPQSYRMLDADWSRTWSWSSRPHVDPAKEATAQETRLRSGTTTLAAEYALQRKDWEQEIRQRAREVQLMKSLGLMPELAEAGAKKVPAGRRQEEDEDED